MKIEELQAHCVEQMRKLSKGSKMYEEHLLTLAIIDTNKKYLNEIDKLNKIIDLIAEQLAGLTIFDKDKDEPIILGDKEEVIKFYERKVEK